MKGKCNTPCVLRWLAPKGANSVGKKCALAHNSVCKKCQKAKKALAKKAAKRLQARPNYSQALVTLMSANCENLGTSMMYDPSIESSEIAVSGAVVPSE